MAEDQLRLVGDLLDIAKIEAGRLDLELGRRLASPSCSALLRGAAAAAAARRRRRAALRRARPAARCAPTRASSSQILRNLIANALKFTAARRGARAAPSAHGDRLRFEVSRHRHRDRAGGPRADLRGVRADPRRAAARAATGTGLGLPLSRKLVGAARAARSTCASAVGEGTTFTVTLPRGGRSPSRRRSPTSPARCSSSTTTRRRATSCATHLRGTRLAGHGGRHRRPAALAACERGVPAAMILDLSMPDLDGTESSRRLRAGERTRAIPVIVHTSRAMSRRRARADRGAWRPDPGQVDHLPATLRAAVAQAIEDQRGA